MFYSLETLFSNCSMTTVMHLIIEILTSL